MGDPSSAPLALPRERHLKQSRDFARIKAQGKRVVSGCLIANWFPMPNAKHSRLGVVTGRRLGNAVARSRARRLLREAFRVHQPELRRTLDVVLVARPSIVGRCLDDVENDYLAALRQGGELELIKQRQPDSRQAVKPAAGNQSIAENG